MEKLLYEITITLPIFETMLLLENIYEVDYKFIKPEIKYKFTTIGIIPPPNKQELTVVIPKSNTDKNSIYVNEKLKDWYDLNCNNETHYTKNLTGDIKVIKFNQKGDIYSTDVYLQSYPIIFEENDDIIKMVFSVGCVYFG